MQYNIVILGDYYVGKTSIINRLLNNSFESYTYSTIGTSYFSKQISLDNINKIINFSIWDTAGQERFRSFVTFYIKKAHIIYLCYDITVSQSFNNLKKWMKCIKEHNNSDKYLGFLIGTKNDLNVFRQVTTEEGHNYADSIGFFFYETSSKLNTNIDTLFEFTIDSFINLYKEELKKEELDLKINIKKKYNYLNYC